MLVGILIGLSVSVAMLDQGWRQTPEMFELDEEIPLPTQRLDLAG